MDQKPFLSIGIIFKNEIRCLERCLNSLQPLREAVPCELVMADTGSDDGSREVAERYADVLFDFPWIDDFAAARNAVLDRSSGEWFLTVDADEWLDADIRELVAFLTAEKPERINAALVTVRNYGSEEESSYSDLYAERMIRVACGVRYEGRIHEHWNFLHKSEGVNLKRTLFHHDGYVELYADTEFGREKRARNMRLLREELEKDPENLMLHMQFLESGQMEGDFVDQVYQSVELVKGKTENWEIVGPSILRHAVFAAHKRKLPEEREWIDMAEEWFSDSAYTQIDVSFFALAYFLKVNDHTEAILRSERYLKALEEDRAGRLDPGARMRSTLLMDTLDGEQTARVVLANLYQEAGRGQEAAALITDLEFAQLSMDNVEKLTRVLMNLQLNTRLDTEPLVRAFWEGVSQPAPDKAHADARIDLVQRTALPAFAAENRKAEWDQADFFRHTYTLFLPLKAVCDFGRAAAILETAEAGEAEALLAAVERWDVLPADALAHALELGVSFPLAERPLNLEEMDGLAAGLAREGEALCGILRRTVSEDFAGSWQMLAWARALALAAVRTCDWKDEGLALARIFAKVEGAFLTGCYAPEVLREGNLRVLPSMHRFGWYCAQAFSALEAGDAAGYARLLRAGLESNPAMKPMVEFLTKHTPELQSPPPSTELLALAEKVKALLAAYPADDPAILAVKASPVYQKVAYLIEGDGR